MRRFTTAALLMLVCATVGVTHAQDGADSKKGQATAARPTAEVGFAALRKAAADRDDETLRACLPSALVASWPQDAADDAKKWRGDLATRIADGSVVGVRESGDTAIARWKGRSAQWELRLRLDGGRWIAAAPWAYCVGGSDLAAANGRKPALVKLKARNDESSYGESAFSFTHVTADPKQCKNRMDVWYCAAGHLHPVNGMASPLPAKSLDELDGIQAGTDWMDQITPKLRRIYLLDLKSEGRRDFQMALQVTACTPDAVEFEWRLVAAGKNAPAGIHKPQPLVSADGADGADGSCATSRKK